MAPKTVLLIFHLLGVVCGVGGVLMLDTHLVRHLRGTRVTLQDVTFTRFVSAFVKVGLIALWVSGLLIIASAPDGAASVLANPKLQAKLVVVVVLTLNALFIETLALPLLARNVGRPLFDGLDQVQRSVILGCGAISTLSWVFPVVLGLARELNHVTPAQVILSYYLVVLVVLGATMQVLGRILYRPTARDAARSDETGATPARPAREIARAGEMEARGPLELAREAGRLTLLDCVSLDSVVQVFGTLGTEEERQQFRTGMFETLRENAGQDVERVIAAIAGDAVLRGKIAAIAPHRLPSEPDRDRAAAHDDGTKWSAVQEWHDSLLDITAGAPPARAPSRIRAAA